MKQSICMQLSAIELLVSAVLVCLVSSCSASAQQPEAKHRAEFWLGAIDPVVQRDRKVNNPSDYMEIFGPPTKWRSVASRTSTLEISTQLVMRGTPEEHQALIASRGIA